MFCVSLKLSALALQKSTSDISTCILLSGTSEFLVAEEKVVVDLFLKGTQEHFWESKEPLPLCLNLYPYLSVFISVFPWQLECP